MKLLQGERNRAAIGYPVARDAVNEKIGGLVKRIANLRGEPEEESVDLPKIRAYDNGDLTLNQALLIWDGKEVWRKDYQ